MYDRFGNYLGPAEYSWPRRRRRGRRRATGQDKAVIVALMPVLFIVYLWAVSLFEKSM